MFRPHTEVLAMANFLSGITFSPRLQQAIVFTLAGAWCFPGANQAQIMRIANDAAWAFEVPQK